jgi:hypothetical protein
MSKIELRKAMNGLGLSVDNEMLNSLIACYQDKSDGGEDSVAYSKFVEDVDPTAFNYAFSAGLCSTSGSFDKIEKEAVVSNLDPPEKIRNTLKVECGPSYHVFQLILRKYGCTFLMFRKPHYALVA